MKAHYCSDRGTAKVPLHECVCVCVCVAEDLTKRITLLWHKSSYLDSRRARKPCKQRVEMTSTHQQAQTHSKANLWTWVPLCHHTSIKRSQFFQGNSSLFRGGNKSEPRPADSPFNSQFLSVAPIAPWSHRGHAGWNIGHRNDFRMQKCHWSSWTWWKWVETKSVVKRWKRSFSPETILIL